MYARVNDKLTRNKLTRRQIMGFDLFENDNDSSNSTRLSAHLPSADSIDNYHANLEFNSLCLEHFHPNNNEELIC